MKFPRPSQEEISVNLTPLIDVVFLLLIFFMVAGQMRAGLVGYITLPDANLETPTPPKAIAIQIDRSGQTYLFGTPTSIEDIQQQLQAHLVAAPGLAGGLAGGGCTR